MTTQLIKPRFDGAIYKPSAVSVRGDDGLLQYGIVVGRQDTELLVIDFQCGRDKIVPVTMDRVYRLTKEGAFEISPPGPPMLDAQPVEPRNVPVEVLFRFTADEPWKWYPGVLSRVLWINGFTYVFVRVIVSDNPTFLACVRAKQIRTPSTQTQIDQLAVRNILDVPVPPHRASTSDPRINQLLPRELLAETFGFLDSVAQWKIRRICTLWRDIHAAARSCSPTHVQLRVRETPSQRLTEPLCTVLHHQAKFLSLVGPRFRTGHRDSWFALGTKCDTIREVVSGFSSVFDGCGYPRLDTVVLSGMEIEVTFLTTDKLHQWPHDILSCFATICRSVIFYNAVLVVTLYLRSALQPLAPRGTGRSFTMPIKKLCMDVTSKASAEQIWTQTDRSQLDRLAENITAHLKKHNSDCDCVGRVLWVLNIMQAADPDSVPEYRNKTWTMDNLAALDAHKLTAIALMAINVCL